MSDALWLSPFVILFLMILLLGFGGGFSWSRGGPVIGLGLGFIGMVVLIVVLLVFFRII
jgi:hypothetical protein